MRALRPHQADAIAKLRSALAAGKRRPMLQMPTGAGKTLTAAAMIDSALAKGKRVAFVVPKLALIEQTVEAFWAEGIRDVGVMQANHAMTRRGAPVQVCSAQTLARRSEPDADLVIVDEAHVHAKAIADWMEAKPNLPFVGLSATPWAKGLGRRYDELIAPVALGELIELGFLTPLRAYAPSRPDLSRVRIVAGEYRDDDLVEAMNPLTGDVVQTWIDKAEGRPTLCFGVDCAHARHLAAEFARAGVPSAYVDGESDKLTRETTRMRFAAGDIKVVCNVGVLTTGVDWDVRCIVLARPTKSEMLYVQMVGRGLRTAEGKVDCLLLDHSDTTLRLGLVTDIVYDKLDDGERQTPAQKAKEERDRAQREPKACPHCKAVVPKVSKFCAACGFEGFRNVEGIETAEGDLVQLDLKRLNKTADWSVKLAFMAQIERHAKATNKSPGWVSNTYRERFGVWPNDPRLRSVAPAGHVDPEVASWIKAKAIRWAKRRDAA